MSERDYSKFITRLSTFEDPSWPRECTVYTKSLAEAGLSYTGEGDLVFCYQCGAVIGQWEEGDDPITRHKVSSQVLLCI